MSQAANLLSNDPLLHNLPLDHAAGELTSLSKSLLRVLAQRHSDRQFSSRTVPLALLAHLLWAAHGVNRQETGQRTAPSAKNWQEIDIYVTQEAGLFRFEPAAAALRQLSHRDLRAATGWQDFVASAPLNLVYVADLGKMDQAPRQEQKFYAALDTGFISQNVYLFCAAQGLATVARAWVDRPLLAQALQLSATQRIILAQSVGFPLHARQAAPAIGGQDNAVTA